MPDPIAPVAKNNVDQRHWAVAGEIVIAIFLAALGVWHIWKVQNPDAWTGFALIGLALLFYMMRGQIITKLSFSKDGFEAEMAELKEKVEAGLEKADSAEQKANFAKEVVSQYGGTPSGQEQVPADQQETESLKTMPRPTPDSWPHPDLKPTKAAPRNDPQKYQWGEMAARNGRLLDAEYDKIDDDWVNVTLRVTSTDPERPIDGSRVRFHLHDSFRRHVVTVKAKNGAADLTRYAYGAFTVGAEVEDEPETFLELDLAEDPEAPARFRSR